MGRVRTEWLDHPDQTNRDNLAGALEQLHTLLKAHLEHEETAVLPIAASVLTDAEWNAVGDAAAAAMPKPALLLAFGMFAYEGDPVVLRTMLASAPAGPRLLVPRIGPRVYARRAAGSTAAPVRSYLLNNQAEARRQLCDAVRPQPCASGPA